MLIHQIWLGNNVPDELNKYIDTWNNIPNTTYKLWRDDDLEIYKRDLILANISTLHASFRSDLLRDLILRDHGGLYIDTDCELIGKIPEFNGFTCVKNPSPTYNFADNYMMYSEKNSKQIKEIIDYGYKTPRWINAFKRFGSGAIIALYDDKYCIDIEDWCLHHHKFSWKKHRWCESVRIQESKELPIKGKSNG